MVKILRALFGSHEESIALDWRPDWSAPSTARAGKQARDLWMLQGHRQPGWFSDLSGMLK